MNNKLALAAGIVGLVVALSWHPSKPEPHAGEASWTLQGQTSKLGCPGAHPWYNEVDGHVFFMGCRISESEMAPPVFTQKAPIIIMGKTPGEYLTRLVDVPSHANLVPLVCFLLPTHRAAECFYVSPETGQTAQVTVVLGREST